MTIRPDDALKYAAALLKQRTDWVLDSIGSSECDHELELDATDDIVAEIVALASQIGGDPNCYSDGRQVVSSKEIARGLTTSHVWHPDATQEKPRSWRSALPSDPGEPSPGIYEVAIDPLTQAIDVTVVLDIGR